ncbi:MAG TPA: sugar ABC transporter substrate-binding protein [Chthoniobacterales bacterium]|jgi:simple sugar transport system substrate-binding protein|nr:sugar ABC transporter substrate-binding protein [Chthoniobacterales bacterium]
MIKLTKLRLFAVFALAVSAIPFSAHAQKKPHIIVVTHGQVSDSFWVVVKNGVEAAAKETNSTVEYRAPEKFDMVALSQLIDAGVASKPDGLIVSIPDASALSKSIQAAVAAKIPVISINSGSDVSKKLGCLLHVGQEEELAGQRAGERMKAEGVKKAAVINQEVGNVALDLRAKGFSEGLGANAEVVAVTMDFTSARNAIAGYLQKNPDVDGILALGPAGAEPALQAIEESGKVGKIKFGTFDLSPTVLQAIDKKQMEFAIDQQQYLQGYLSVMIMANYIKYGLLPANDVVLTGPGFVTAETAKQVIDLSKKGIR